MSNERIDLTQFIGITEGYADGAWELNNPQDTHCLVPLVGTIAAFSEANANAVVQLPKLIAELKRCYEEKDALSKFAQEILIEEEPGYWVYNEERYPDAALDALDLLRSFLPTSE